MNENEIVQRARQGDKAAFEWLVNTYQDRVYSLTLRMCGNEDDAFDLSQDAFIKAWKGLESFRFDSAFSTWLFRLATNVCLDFLRSKKRRPVISLTVADDEDEETQFDIPDTRPNPEEAAILSEDRAALKEALGALDPDSRNIIILRVINDLSYEQIADILGIQVGTVKSRLSRARQKLKDKLSEIRNKKKKKTSTKTENPGKEGRK